VYTLGLNGKREHLLRENEIPVVAVDRGGQVTYHGPGQAVAYILCDIQRLGLGVNEFVNRLEQSIIDLLDSYQISAQRKAGAPGVYVEGSKIAALGLRIKRGRSYHGLSLNVDMDLSPFADINPCGYPQQPVTQLKDLGIDKDINEVNQQLIKHLQQNLGYNDVLRVASSEKMPEQDSKNKSRPVAGEHQRGADKVARIPIKVEPTVTLKRKPAWIRAKSPAHPEVQRLKKILREQRLHTVCEEASCPNLGECFGHGTATFMIMGDICTRRCPFCDVAHGKPLPLDTEEPVNLANTIKAMGLRYVVITSVDRDDLRDGGAGHFVDCISEVRSKNPDIKIEILVPDFRGRMDVALEIMNRQPPDVFNHNLETVPRLYKKARPGADYQWSLNLIKSFKALYPDVPTKSGLMLGLGETLEEVQQVMQDLRDHNCDMLTLGQYLQPSLDHLPVDRFVTPEEFDQLAEIGKSMGFTQVASGPMVRSSYHADLQAAEIIRQQQDS
jgi:lipoic acid synthetase